MKIFIFLSIMGVLAIVLCSCNITAGDPVRHVQDGFDHGKEQWSVWHDPAYPTIHCDSVVDANFGLPAPSLSLTNKPGQCSGAEILSGMMFTNGIVELDIYLQTDALVEVIFRGDLEKNTGYTARLDSRDYPDTFVKIDTWKMLGENSGHTTSTNQWHHMRVEVEDSSFTLFCDGQVVARAVDPEYVSGRIALMNEVNGVYVDNVTVLSKGNAQETSTNGLFNLRTLTIAGLLVFGISLGCAILLIGISIGFLIRKR